MKSNDNSKSFYVKVKNALWVASQFVITAPLKLPPKVVAVAKYVALALGVLDAVESGLDKQEHDGDENE